MSETQVSKRRKRAPAALIRVLGASNHTCVCLVVVVLQEGPRKSRGSESSFDEFVQSGATHHGVPLISTGARTPSQGGAASVTTPSSPRFGASRQCSGRAGVSPAPGSGVRRVRYQSTSGSEGGRRPTEEVIYGTSIDVTAVSALGIPEMEPKSPRTTGLLNEVLSKHFFFGNLTAGPRESVVHAMKRRSLLSNEVLVRKGDTGESFFVVTQGQLTAAAAGEEMRIVNGFAVTPKAGSTSGDSAEAASMGSPGFVGRPRRGSLGRGRSLGSNRAFCGIEVAGSAAGGQDSPVAEQQSVFGVGDCFGELGLVQDQVHPRSVFG